MGPDARVPFGPAPMGPWMREEIIRSFTVKLLGAAAIVAGLMVLRHQKQTTPRDHEEVARTSEEPSEKVLELDLDRLRELGI